MSGIVVRTEAMKPLTGKRIFETKLKGVRLCMTFDDLLNNLPLLIESNIFKDNGQEQFTVKYKITIFYSGNNPISLLTLDVGNAFTTGHLL